MSHETYKGGRECACSPIDFEPLSKNYIMLFSHYSDVACTGQVVLTNSLHQLKTDINSIEYYCHLYKEVQIVPTTMIGWYENVN